MTANATKIAFVDDSIADSQNLIASLGADVEVVCINGEDGLFRMAEVLQDRSDLDSVMVFSHGAPGKVFLGDAELSSATLDRYADALAVIGGALTEQGDLLFYGCDVGAGEAGRTLVNELARLTGADVAASDDPSGGAAQGGDWDLEVQSGTIDLQSLAHIDSSLPLSLLAYMVTLSIDNTNLAEEGGTATITAHLSAACWAAIRTTISLSASGSATGGGVDYTLSSNTIDRRPLRSGESFPTVAGHRVQGMSGGRANELPPFCVRESRDCHDGRSRRQV